MYENKLEFPGGRGGENKNLPWGEYGYFLELHNAKWFKVADSKFTTPNIYVSSIYMVEKCGRSKGV